MIEVCHGIERYPNPAPHRNEGGDCFACALAASLKFLYPELEHTLDEWFDIAYELFEEEYTDMKAQGNLRQLREAVGLFLDDGDRQALEHTYSDVLAERAQTTVGNYWSGFERALQRASWRFGHLEIIWDMVKPEFDRRTFSYPWGLQLNSLEYARRLEGWLRGGWVAFTEIDMDGLGPTGLEDGRPYLNSTDHFVILDGVRHVYVEERDADGEFKHGSWEDYVHVVCSSRRNLTGWHRTRDFLLRHAGSSWWLARRDVR